MKLRGTLCLLLALAAMVVSGCARRTPVADLGGSGAEVGVQVTLDDGETLRGRLLSMSDDRMLVEAYYSLEGEVRLAGIGERRTLEADGRPVSGEVVSVEREGTERIAVVRREVRLGDVERASFHRASSEASLGPILSLLVGPTAGALLALAL